MLFAGEEWCCLPRSDAVCRGAVLFSEERCCLLLYKNRSYSTIEVSTSTMVFSKKNILLLPDADAVLGWSDAGRSGAVFRGAVLFAKERC